MTRYRCVDAQKAAGFPVAAACRAAGVTRSAYYAWANGTVHGPAQRQRAEARVSARSAASTPAAVAPTAPHG